MRSAITMNLSRLRLFWAVTLKLELTYQYRTRVVPAKDHCIGNMSQEQRASKLILKVVNI